LSMNELFTYMSICAVVGGDIFCVHGGISTSGFNRNQLRNLRKPILWSEDDSLVHNMLWSDPAKGLKGTSNNSNVHLLWLGRLLLRHAQHRMRRHVQRTHRQTV
ncbi:hypothetical protein PENTCL1PPCAC_4458, partial [Pristionchus entomophagus]